MPSIFIKSFGSYQNATDFFSLFSETGLHEVYYANGYQEYNCINSKWKRGNSIADLYEEKSKKGKITGIFTHQNINSIIDAVFVTPNDTSKLNAQFMELFDSDSNKNLPLLLSTNVKDNGIEIFKNTEMILRINTHGGKPLSESCMNDSTTIPFTSEYWVLKGTAKLPGSGLGQTISDKFDKISFSYDKESPDVKHTLIPDSSTVSLSKNGPKFRILSSANIHQNYKRVLMLCAALFFM